MPFFITSFVAAREDFIDWELFAGWLTGKVFSRINHMWFFAHLCLHRERKPVPLWNFPPVVGLLRGAPWGTVKCLGRQRTRVFAGFPTSTHRFLPHVVPELCPQSKKHAQLPLLRAVFLKVIIPCLTLSEKSEHTSFPTAKLNADDDRLALVRGCLKLLSGSRV